MIGQLTPSGRGATNPSTKQLAVAYVSLVVPPRPEFDNAALHRTGNSFMLNFLRQLNAGFPGVVSVSASPIPAFPRDRALVVRGQTAELEPGLTTQLVSFLNVTPIKQLWIGAAVLGKLVSWARKRRDARRLIFIYNTSVPHIAFSLLAARLTGSAIVAFIGDIYVPGQTAPDTLWYRGDFALQRRLIGKLDGLVAVSDKIARDFFGPGRDYLRLDAAMDESIVQTSAELLASAPAPSASTTTLVHSGSLTAYNGTAEILEAFSQLSDPNLRLRVAGRGPLAAAVVEAAAKDSRIEYLGYLSYDELLAVHAAADILISFRITSSMETGYAFPSKTMEYLASGVPVITTRTGHMEQEYGSYCYLVDDESSAGLAKAIEAVLREAPEDRRNRAAAARAYIVENKTWPAQGARIRRYVDAVMARARS